MTSPVDVVLARYEALRDGDYARIYWTSHPDSTLRQSFRRLDDYLLFARTHLRGALSVETVNVLLAETDGVQARLALHIVQRDGKQRTEVIERVGLVHGSEGWLCRDTARVMRSAFPESLSDLSWGFFDQCPEVVHY